MNIVMNKKYVSTKQSRDLRKALLNKTGKLLKTNSAIDWTEFPTAWSISDQATEFPTSANPAFMFCDIILCDDPPEKLSDLPGTPRTWFYHGGEVDIVALKILFGEKIVFLSLVIGNEASTFDELFNWITE